MGDGRGVYEPLPGPKCSYIDPSQNGECQLWASCDEDCNPSACWNWWVTYENLDRPSGAAWNTTACDALPEQPAGVVA